jgi:hypothetical protein
MLGSEYLHRGQLGSAELDRSGVKSNEDKKDHQSGHRFHHDSHGGYGSGRKPIGGRCAAGSDATPIMNSLSFDDEGESGWACWMTGEANWQMAYAICANVR